MPFAKSVIDRGFDNENKSNVFHRFATIKIGKNILLRKYLNSLTVYSVPLSDSNLKEVPIIWYKKIDRIFMLVREIVHILVRLHL